MQKINKYLIITYGCLLLAGIVLFFFRVSWAAYVFTAGAVVAIVESFMSAMQHRSTEVAVARRHRLYFIASLFLGVAAWYMFVGSNNFIVMTLIWVVIVFYLSFRKS